MKFANKYLKQCLLWAMALFGCKLFLGRVHFVCAQFSKHWNKDPGHTFFIINQFNLTRYLYTFQYWSARVYVFLCLHWIRYGVGLIIEVKHDSVYDVAHFHCQFHTCELLTEWIYIRFKDHAMRDFINAIHIYQHI